MVLQVLPGAGTVPRTQSKKVSLVTAVAKANCNSQKLCQARVEPPPGRLIYLKGDYTIYEVDGEEDQVRSQEIGAENSELSPDAVASCSAKTSLFSPNSSSTTNRSSSMSPPSTTTSSSSALPTIRMQRGSHKSLASSAKRR